jgi:hypothetical protein
MYFTYKIHRKTHQNDEKLFSIKPIQNVTSPLDKGDHPELDTSELCTEEQNISVSIHDWVTMGSHHWKIRHTHRDNDYVWISYSPQNRSS